MSNAAILAKNFYVAGGTLRPNAPSYVERQADQKLLDAVLAGEFCYVLTPRQMGKSSLMARTADKLRKQNVRVAILDLTTMGTGEDQDRWYYTIASKIHSQTGADWLFKSWWDARRDLTATQRLSDFFAAVAESASTQAVIFVDEIDTTIGLGFTDDFFAAIRACYNSRATDPRFDRLSFVLLGVATPMQLIHDRSRTPFNIGRGINLDDFSPQEARQLTSGLGHERILEWTGGHPYLTQAVCQCLAYGESLAESAVDAVVEKMFLSPRSLREDLNLKHVADRLVRGGRQVLQLVQSLAQGLEVADDPKSGIHNDLKLSGIVRVKDDGCFVYRNRIYREAFSESWAKKEIRSLPENFFIVGAPLSPNAPCYVERKADHELMGAVTRGEMCFLFGPRESGKTSLLLRASTRLREEGMRTALLDLSVHGALLNEEAWSRAFMEDLGSQVNLDVPDMETIAKDPSGQLFEFLNKARGKVDVVLVDEFDSIRYAIFAANSFRRLRSTCDDRAPNFVLAGSILPSQLVSAEARPFDLSRFVNLDDFKLSEARCLTKGLPDDSAEVLDRIFYWTGGHPYLTQRLSRELSAGESVDEVVKRLFFRPEWYEANLGYAGKLLSHVRPLVLESYREIIQSRVGYVPEDSAQWFLLATGFAKMNNEGVMVVRNRIYQQVLSQELAEQSVDKR